MSQSSNQMNHNPLHAGELSDDHLELARSTQSIQFVDIPAEGCHCEVHSDDFEFATDNISEYFTDTLEHSDNTICDATTAKMLTSKKFRRSLHDEQTTTAYDSSSNKNSSGDVRQLPGSRRKRPYIVRRRRYKSKNSVHNDFSSNTDESNDEDDNYDDEKECESEEDGSFDQKNYVAILKESRSDKSRIGYSHRQSLDPADKWQQGRCVSLRSRVPNNSCRMRVNTPSASGDPAMTKNAIRLYNIQQVRHSTQKNSCTCLDPGATFEGSDSKSAFLSYTLSPFRGLRCLYDRIRTCKHDLSLFRKVEKEDMQRETYRRTADRSTNTSTGFDLYDEGSPQPLYHLSDLRQSDHDGSASHHAVSMNKVFTTARRKKSRLEESQRLTSSQPNSYLGSTPQSREKTISADWKGFLLLLVILFTSAFVLWQIYLAVVADDNYLGVVLTPSRLGQFERYAVSTDAKYCGTIGKNLLAKGGHAVDAAIGTLLCMGVVLPNSLGIGGGCLMTIYDNETKQASVIDGREIAPDYATENMFNSNGTAASRGPLSIGIPGELAAYWMAHKKYGKLKWSQLFDETIEMAENGLPTVKHLAEALRDWSHAQYIRPPLNRMFTNIDTKQYYAEGEIYKLPALANSLKIIRDEGVNAFYNGRLGRWFVDDLRENYNGKITFENLQKYQAVHRQALEFEIDENLKVYTPPVPGSGVVLGVILRIMRGLGYGDKDKRPQESFEASALYYHHLTEAMKFAYARRPGLEDEPDDEIRMAKLMNKLKSDEFIAEAVRKIGDKTLPSSEYGGFEYFQEDHGTAHVSVIDENGNSVATTTSVNLYFGSGLVSPRTGIIYNDIMDDFVSPNITNKFMLRPSLYNRIRPGRRPLSSMAPSIFVNRHGNPVLIIGSSGGAKITSSIALVSIRNALLGDDIKTSIDAARIHHQYLPEEVMHESNFPQELLDSLKARGHRINPIVGRSSVVMAIACDYSNNTVKLITANSDHRKGGSVDGL